jgi:DMSO/TMAO reductase YedYZ heme-binding membrane subunit
LPGQALGVLSAIGLFGLVAISFPRISRILRMSYERWLFLHRLTGLFVLLGVVHGLLVDLIIGSSVTLQVVYLAVGANGSWQLRLRRVADASSGANYCVHGLECQPPSG